MIDLVEPFGVQKFCYSVILLFCYSVTCAVERYEINAGWTFRQQNFGEWRKATVPGTVHTDLLAVKAIDEPFYRTNERGQQWIDKVNWEYQTVFDAPYIDGKDSVVLTFNGLDTYAEVTLNGKHILSSNNMFLRHRVNVTGLLKEKDNCLHVLFSSPIFIGLQKFTEWGMPIMANNDNSEMGGLGPKNKVSVFTRKAGYHYGWDWGPRFVTCGIWRPVAVECWNTAHISDFYIHTVNASEKTAVAAIKLEIDASSAGNYDVAIYIGGRVLKNRYAIDKKFIMNDFVTFKNPRLWHPNGMGEPFLYDVKVTLSRDGKLLDTKEAKLGLRTVKLIQKKDKDGNGRSFYFEINGTPVFCKGSNYIPNDLFLPRVDSAKLEHIVRSAAEANHNMLRVWGGGTYENDIFYKLCDKYGIMVWQDFMFACSTYPGDREFVDNVRREAIDNLKRLRNHPCIVIWCGNNEIEVALQPWDNEMMPKWRWRRQYTLEQQRTHVRINDTLFRQVLPATVAQYSAENIYWASSPSPGEGMKYADTNQFRYGDVHFWGVWHQGLPFEEYNKKVPRFMSEFGLQSFPEFATVKTFTEPDDWDIESEVMMAHQRNGIGNLRIRQYMENDYRLPPTFEGMLYLSQVLQAEGIKHGIEAHRRNMAWCMGSLYWQINDCWPVASWSSIDSYGRWKALHYFVKKAFENVIVNPYLHGDTLDIYVVSDLHHKINGTLELSLLDFTGRKLSSKKIKADIAANASTKITTLRTGELLAGADPTKLMLLCSFGGKDVNFSTLKYFDKVKNLALPDAKPVFEVRKTDANTAVVTVSSNLLAKNVALYYKGVAGIFSDNYFDLLPGQKIEVTLATTDDAATVKNDITLHTLKDIY